MAAYGQYVPPAKRSSDIGHVMVTIAATLQWIGLMVDPQSWSVATDEDGVVLKLRWMQHHSQKSSWRRPNMEKSGNTDIGTQNRGGSPQRKQKSPSKIKRDKERWERHLKRIQQGTNQENGGNVNTVHTTVSDAMVDPKVDKAVVKDSAPCDSQDNDVIFEYTVPSMDTIASVHLDKLNLNVNASIWIIQ